MKVGVIGSTGFVGINLIEELNKYDMPNVGCSRRTGVDATDFESLSTWIINNKIECVVNLAAECGGIGLNEKRPFDLWLSTTKISANVLDVVKTLKIQKLVSIGTVCSYAKYAPVPFSEDYIMNYGMPEETNAPYGIAKLNGIVGTQALYKQYGINVFNLIPVNMYGPHDHFDLENSHVIPAIIRKVDDAIKNGDRNIKLWGTGNATREFLYVKDLARAIILAIECSISVPEFINIGIGSEISINDLARKICDIMKYDGNIVWNSFRPDGQPRRCLDVSRAERLLRFVAETDLDKGLNNTISWYLNSGFAFRQD